MQKIKTFLNTFIKSLTSISYYKDILLANPSFSMKYFFVLMGLITIITAGVNTYVQVPKLKEFIQKTTIELTDKYPEDLVVKIEDGTLSTNRVEPFIVPMSSEAKQDPSLNFTNLLVLDTNGTVEDIQKYDTMVLINSKNILVQDVNRGRQTHAISNFQNMEITKSVVSTKALELTENLNKSLILSPIVFAGFIIVYTIYYFFAKLIYMLICAVVIFVFMKINGGKEHFVRAIQISAHTITLVIVIETITLLLNVNQDLSTIVFTIHMIFAYIVVASLNLRNRIQNN